MSHDLLGLISKRAFMGQLRWCMNGDFELTLYYFLHMTNIIDAHFDTSDIEIITSFTHV